MLWFGAGVATATLPDIKEKQEVGNPVSQGAMHHYSTKITTIRAPHSSQATNQHLVIVHGDRTLNWWSVAIFGKMHSAMHTVLKIASYSVVPSLCSLPGKTKPVDLFTFQTDVATRKLSFKLLLPPWIIFHLVRRVVPFFVCKSNHSLTHSLQ